MPLRGMLSIKIELRMEQASVPVKEGGESNGMEEVPSKLFAFSHVPGVAFQF
jgi:hypothetical protein